MILICDTKKLQHFVYICRRKFTAVVNAHIGSRLAIHDVCYGETDSFPPTILIEPMIQDLFQLSIEDVIRVTILDESSWNINVYL